MTSLFMHVNSTVEISKDLNKLRKTVGLVTWPSHTGLRQQILRDGFNSWLKPIAFDVSTGWLLTRRAQAHFAVSAKTVEFSASVVYLPGDIDMFSRSNSGWTRFLIKLVLPQPCSPTSSNDRLPASKHCERNEYRSNWKKQYYCNNFLTNILMWFTVLLIFVKRFLIRISFMK